ncbi:TonB-dependent receptor [Permianibacter sp. IMCC34836]|uniref:TonB-dependent receptor n=1 Tax=Permianibacter fluminis TaxID=2738515 RepID=UPI001555B03B|nr:TonB-dependent receptor [Permianibacter fluminis]NQD37508.1 TonB-dependent receptor [Permianibacter fluminis]
MVQFKRSILSLALASALQTVSAGAHAQDADPQATAEQSADGKGKKADDAVRVEVTGIRGGIEKALDTKRESDVIVDVVDAGALSSLPDQSITDALARIPGVTTMRDSGQSAQLNIRGMNGDFIQTTLNGREQATTSAYTESSRWMSFDQYPAELITQGAVYKSPKASHIEGGVAATVELKTANPLKAQKDHNFNASVRKSYNDAAGDVGSDENGERFSVSYLGKFLDDKLGVGVGYAHLKQPNNFEGSRAGADSQIGYGGPNNRYDFDGDGTDEYYARAFQWQAGTGNDERDGYLATVVFQPNDSLKASVDYFKSKFESEDFRHGITVSGLARPDNYSLTSPVINNGILTGGTVSLTDPRTRGDDSSPWFESRTEDQSTQADSEAYGFNVEWSVNDQITLNFDISHSDAVKTRKDRLASLHAYEFGTATGMLDGNSVTGPTWQELSGQSMTFVGNGDGTPTAAFNTDYTDLSYMRLSRYEEYPHKYSDEIDSYKVDFKMELDWQFVSSIEAGARYSDRMFDSRRGTFLFGSRQGQFNYVDGNGDWQSYCEDNLSNPFVACAPQSVDGFVTVGSVAGVPDHLVVDLDGIANSIFGAGNYTGRQVFSRDWTFVESGGLQEKTKAYYLLANINAEIGDTPVSGNVGVRVVQTDVKASGVQNVGSANGVPITDDAGVTQSNYAYVKYGPEYTDVLPSLNLNFELTESDVLRFAAAEVMGRPPAGKLKGGAGSWNSGNSGEIYNVWTKGSPYLDPFRATQYDLSYEHYFEDGGAVTAAVFYKDIESLVQKNFYPENPLSPDGNAALFASLGLEVPEGQIAGAYETYRNSDKGGYIRGYELAATNTFSSLPGVFSGLGVTASYSYTESEAEIDGGGLFAGQKLPIPGLSKDVWSATVFWDIGGFSAHVNARYRGDYIFDMTIPGSSTPAKGKEYTTIDAQASYAFDNGVSVVLQGTNLTDEESLASYGLDNALGEYKTFGRTYFLGLNYKY